MERATDVSSGDGRGDEGCHCWEGQGRKSCCFHHEVGGSYESNNSLRMTTGESKDRNSE